VLRCEECAAGTAGYASGWSAFYVQVADEDAEPVLVTYCADCAKREFGWILRWLAASNRTRLR